MKLLIVACLISTALAIPFMQPFTSGRTFMSERPPPVAVQSAPTSGRSAGPPITATRTATRTALTPAGVVGNPYGPKAYGPGLNNPYSFPPNQFFMDIALQLAEAQPGLLVRVETDGEITLTDVFGREVDGVYDNFGRDWTEIYDF